MGLMQWSPAFQFCVDNVDDSVIFATIAAGTAFTPGSSNADGTAVSVLSALAKDIVYLTFEVGVETTAAQTGTNNCAQLELLIDPAGGTSWSSFATGFLIGGPFGAHVWGGFPIRYYLPIWIPAGASIGVQARTAGTGRAHRILMRGYGMPKFPGRWWAGQKIETLGYTAAESRGTLIPPDASASTFGAWTTVGTTTRRYGAVQFCEQIVNSTTGTTATFVHEYGHGSEQLPGTSTYRSVQNTTETKLATGYHSPALCDIAAGTIMQARASSSTGSASSGSLNVTILGVY